MSVQEGVRIRTFYDLTAWQEGHKLAIAIYELTQKFPREEVFGLTSQLRRAASSITANIAEGFARYHFKDKTRFYYQARGSAAEVQNFLTLAKDIQLIKQPIYQQLHDQADATRQLINGLIRSIERQ